MSTLFQIDAFTAEPFKGNPAAVCLLTQPKDPAWMQQVAAEMNLSETAFVHRDGENFGLRWFTPACEVDLCGHATLAAAHALWEHRWLKPFDVAHFSTRSGTLTAEQGEHWIHLDFPKEVAEESGFPDELLRGLGAVNPRWVGRNRLDYLVELESEATVRAFSPNLAALAGLESRGVIVTAPADPGEFDFVSRYFAPSCGIAEDPVTGSAHCALAPYWSKKLGKTRMTGYQASQRGGTVRVEVGADRVKLSGQAVTVFRGQLV